jgi:hypothetical protein
MSGPHDSGKGTNRRAYDAEAWNNSVLWNKTKLTKQDGHHTGNTEEGVLPSPKDGELSTHIRADKKA